MSAGTPPRDTASGWHWSITLLLGFALAHGTYQFGRALLHHKQGLDLAPEYVAAHMFLEGGDRSVYNGPVLQAQGRRLGLHGPLGETDPIIEYAYPPWVLPLYAPLTGLPWDAARRVWFALGLAAVLGAAALTAATVATPGARRVWAVGGLAATGLYFPAAYGLMAGQSNDILLLGLALSLALLTRGRSFLGGLVLAPVAAWKLFTGFPLLLMVARRDGRALAGCAVGVLALIGASLPVVGTGAWRDWIEYIGPAKAATVAPRNHSIAGNVMLLLSDNPVSPPLVERPDLVGPVTLALQATAVLIAVAALWRRARRDEPRFALQFGVTLILGVLLTPRAWEHYGVFLLPAFLAAAAVARERGSRIAGFMLGASFAVWGLTFQLKDDYLALAARGATLLVPAKLYATLLLLGVCAWLSWDMPHGAPQSPQLGHGTESDERVGSGGHTGAAGAVRHRSLDDPRPPT